MQVNDNTNHKFLPYHDKAALAYFECLFTDWALNHIDFALQ